MMSLQVTKFKLIKFVFHTFLHGLYDESLGDKVHALIIHISYIFTLLCDESPGDKVHTIIIHIS